MAIAERELTALETSTPHFSEEDYLAREELAEEKSEIMQGRIVPMSGGTLIHGLISANILACLWIALRGGNCRVSTSDVKVRTPNGMFYPDVSVVCGTPEYYTESKTVISNPVMLVEVLSPSTGAKDRGDKFLAYQQIETLQFYLLVSQDTPLVELFSRGENGHWDYTQTSGMESTVEIPALSVTLVLADIYDQINFSDQKDE